MADVLTPVRTHNGRFAPGTSGNPGGRVGLPGELRQQLEEAAPQAVARLVQLLDCDDPRVVLAAAETLLSRLYGRPAQAVDTTLTKQTDIGRAHLQALEEIRQRRDLRLAAETVEN